MSKSLVDLIHEVLLRHSEVSARNWLAVFKPALWPTNDLYKQQRIVNAFWRAQLGSLNVDTFPQRLVLNDHDPFDYWLDNFDRWVAGTIALHQLPRLNRSWT